MFSLNSARASFFTACLASLLLVASSARAAVIFNFDENGKGTVTQPSGVVTNLVSLGNQPDPFDPGNGLLPLVYQLPVPPGVTPTFGDMDVFEPAVPAPVLSDLL